MSLFSNGTEYEEFHSLNCLDCRLEPTCQLIDNALLNEDAEKPDAWHETGRMSRYVCLAKYG